MTDLREILREEYIKQINQLDLRMLLGMVEEVMGTPPQITEETAPTIGADVDEEETLSMILRMILPRNHARNHARKFTKM